MPYRLVALLDALPDYALKFDHRHEAELVAGRLCLRGTIMGDKSGGPLRDLINAARSREWASRLSDYAPQFDRLEAGIDEQAAVFARRLRDGGLWGLPGPGINVPRDAYGLENELRNIAKRIMARKTVFLIPDYRLKSWRDESMFVQIIVEIAQELAAYLETSHLNDIGFVKLRRPTPKRPDRPEVTDDDDGVMNRLSEKLLEKSDPSFGEGRNRYSREGPLLLDGETGTGKSLRAKLIAESLTRKFVAVNLSGISSATLESRMRGHVKGAFTDAKNESAGWFADADQGVLFLDELQNGSLEFQAQLLDLLSPTSNTVRVDRMGDSRRRRFDVKVVLATNKPVSELLAARLLREDLFYRIRDVVTLPSFNSVLRGEARRSETPLAFIRRLFHVYRWKASPFGDEGRVSDGDFASLFPEVAESVVAPILKFDWKGNYRQFERVASDIHWQNDMDGKVVIDAATMLAQLAAESKRVGTAPGPAAGADGPTAEVEALLLAHGFNIGETVKALGKSRFSLGSRQTLRAFLREHQDSLSDAVRKDSKIVRFLEAGSGKSPPNRPG